MGRLRALNPVEQALLVGGLYLFLIISGSIPRIPFLGFLFLAPIYAATLLVGNAIAASFFGVFIGAACAGLVWFAMCFAIADLRLRPFGFAATLLIMSGLSIASNKVHEAGARQRNVERAQYERAQLAGPNVDYDTFIRRGVRPGMSGLDFMYSLLTNRDLAGPAIPHLKKFIEEDGKRGGMTYQRRLAAQVVFELTGERVPYRGIENDRQNNKDPYIR